MFSRDQIDQVRASIDIVEVIREYVPSLKAAGRSVRGLCPFHSERTPSFHVHPEKGIFKCFGCGESGDAIGFIVKLEQVGFTEALEMLAERAGIRLQKQSGLQAREPEGIREKLHRVLEAAAHLYEDMLWDERLGQGARSYLTDRGVSDETARLFHLGVAGPTSVSVFETLVKKGYPIELCQQAGLVSRSSSGRFYDPMFGRLIFPIFDGFGHVIGFGGRTLPSSQSALFGSSRSPEESEGPKYLNSPETPVFSKGKSLYGLPQAKPNILSNRSVILLEGYMDVVGLHQGGVKNAVATLGTAFTKDHAKLLKRYAVEAAFAFFDPDEAGRKAALRSLEPLLQEEIFPRIVVPEGTSDPDELILEKGKDYFDSLIAQSPDFVDYLLSESAASPMMSLQRKSDVAKQLVELIGRSPNDILKSEWLGRVAEKLGLQRESLIQELQKRRTPAASEVPLSSPRTGKPMLKLPSAEEEFLQLLLTYADIWPGNQFSAGEFSEDRHRKLYSLMAAQIQKQGRFSIPSICEDCPEEYREWVVQLSLEDKDFPEPLLRRDQLIRDIRLKRSKVRLNDLKERVAKGLASAEEQGEYRNLLRQVKGSIPGNYAAGSNTTIH